MPALEIPITQVTVLEDRAFVRRAAQVEVPAGFSRWHLKGVANVLVDKTLTAELSGGARLLQARVERYQVSNSAPPPPSEDEAKRAEREAKRSRLQIELALLQQEQQSARTLYQELLADISLRTAWGEAHSDSWQEQIEKLLAWRQELSARSFELEQEIAALQTGPTPIGFAPIVSSLHTDIVLEIDSPQAQQLDMAVEYGLPSACWRPAHRATWLGDRVLFEGEACLWQNTGEDWNNVELVLSTERISLGTTPPGLEIDRLTAKKKATEVVVAEREVSVQSLGDSLPEGVARVATEMPGIFDGGLTVKLRSPQKCSVPSHGQPVRVPLFSFEAESCMENVLKAEICQEVVQQTRLQNRSGYALLAGPVELVRESGWVGRAKIDYIGAGDTFRLGWGPQSSLRTARHVSQSSEEKDDMLGGWMKTQNRAELTLSNLSRTTHRVLVTERVPVSEHKGVEIVWDVKTSTSGATPDENGFVTWEIELAPYAHQKIVSCYYLRRRKEVVT
jgi:uncharacterized protein (TIGR02231 family)